MTPNIRIRLSKCAFCCTAAPRGWDRRNQDTVLSIMYDALDTQGQADMQRSRGMQQATEEG